MIDLKSVYKSFNVNTVNEIELYHDLNLHINEGEFVTIIGSNGSGKSTLFNILCGNVAPDKGDIFFDEDKITALAEHKRLKRFARVYQDPLKGTSPSLTILENISIADNKGHPFNLTKGVNKKKINQYKDLLRSLDLNLEDKLNVSVSALSGGQRQALSLLMATMNDPELLLLDEHTAALDPKTSELIIQLTNRIVSERRMTTLMVTHNLKHAIDYGNRLLMFHKGQVITDIDADEKKQLSVQKLIERFNTLNVTDDLSDTMVFA